MLHQFKQVLTNIIRHGMHSIIGLDLVLLGLNLMNNDSYFNYPPFATSFLNDDVVGFVGVVTGIGLLIWTSTNDKDLKVLTWLMTFAGGFLILLSILEVAHSLVNGLPHATTAFISTFSLFLIVLCMAFKTNTRK